MAIKLSATRLDLGNARLDNADFRAYAETQNALGNVSGATTIDLSLGTVITATTTAATTFSVTNIPSSTQYVSFTLVLTNGGRFTVTWMSGTKWQNSTAPTLSVIGTDVLTFFTTDNGTTWRGSVMMPSVSSGSQMFVWGKGFFGRLGLGDTTNRSSPTQLIGSWGKIGLGENNSTHIRTDGTMWSMGNNINWELGLGDSIKRSSPVQISGTWADIRKGNSHSAALKPDGTLWTWGINTVGNLGLGDLAARNTPTQVGIDSWSSISAGRNLTGGLKSDGSLWIWGQNYDGSLGLGDTVHRSSPVQVAGTWSSFFAFYCWSAALKSDGSLWVWGKNDLGQLGLSDTIDRSSPVQSAGTWSSISGYKFAMRIASNNTLWATGNNTDGCLGLGDEANRSSPVQVPGTWTGVVATGYPSLRPTTRAFRSDSTLWTWGGNLYGNLGLGDTIKRSSPVQLAGAWGTIDTGGTLNGQAAAALKP